MYCLTNVRKRPEIHLTPQITQQVNAEKYGPISYNYDHKITQCPLTVSLTN